MFELLVTSMTFMWKLYSNLWVLKTIRIFILILIPIPTSQIQSYSMTIWLLRISIMLLYEYWSLQVYWAKLMQGKARGTFRDWWWDWVACERNQASSKSYKQCTEFSEKHKADYWWLEKHQALAEWDWCWRLEKQGRIFVLIPTLRRSIPFKLHILK